MSDDAKARLGFYQKRIDDSTDKPGSFKMKKHSQTLLEIEILSELMKYMNEVNLIEIVKKLLNYINEFDLVNGMSLML